MKKIIIKGKMLQCKKGIYIISTLKKETSKVFNDLIELVNNFCEKPNSKQIQILIDEKSVEVSFTPPGFMVKEFDQDEKSLKVLEKYNQALLEIEKLD